MNTEFWNKFTNKYLFQNTPGEEFTSNCSPSSETTQQKNKKETNKKTAKKKNDYVAIDLADPSPPQYKKDQTGLQNVPDVEDLYIDPMNPVYIEPYEAEMRKQANYKGDFDCYYENGSHILSSDEDKLKYV